MARVSILFLFFITLVTGCSGQLRKPALVVGGALTIGGIVMASQASSRDCGSEMIGGPDFECAGEAIGGTVLGMIITGIGAGLLVGAAVAGSDEPDPAPVQQSLAPVSIPEPASPDPSNPPPAMEPEPAQW